MQSTLFHTIAALVCALLMVALGPRAAEAGARQRSTTQTDERQTGTPLPDGVGSPERAGPSSGDRTGRERPRTGRPPDSFGSREEGPVAIRTDRIRLVGAEPAAPATDAPVAVSTDPIQLVGATPPEPAAPVAVTTDPIRLEGYEPAATGTPSPFPRRNRE